MRKYNRGKNGKEFVRNYVAETTTETFPFWEEGCDQSVEEPIEEDIERGWYFVLTTSVWAEDDPSVIVEGEPHVVVAFYYGNGEWDNDLLSGIYRNAIPVKYPEISDFEGRCE